MLENNKLDKVFGPVGSPAGVFIFIAGLILTFISFPGTIIKIVLLLIGAFIGFTSTGTIIDYHNKRIKFSNNLFGFIKIGQWIKIDPEMKIGIKKSNRAWRAYSRANQTIDIVNKDFRIILYDSGNNHILTIKKTNTLNKAKAELEKLGNQLGLRTI
jgi:uncharacterized membrane protein